MPLHPAALSIKVFGVYASFSGLGLILMPEFVLGNFGIAAPQDIWVRVLGALGFVIGFYYWICGSAGSEPFFKASVIGRLTFAVLSGYLVVAYQGPWQLMLFAAADVGGALWTLSGLRRAKAAAPG